MPSCHSTNDICAELVSKGSIINGTIVITDFQTEGRGQASNKWESESGANLTFSVILDTSFLPIQSQFYLNIMASCSLIALLNEYLGEGAIIKWPNDIYFGRNKICGILIQNILKGNKLEYSIIGLGINVNQQQFKVDNAVSLTAITGRWYDLSQILSRTTEILEAQYMLLKTGMFEKLKGKYLKKLMWLNEDHEFESHERFTGRITGIDEIGRLLVQTVEGVKTFNFKEVKFVL